MLARDRNYYLRLRKQHEPKKLNLVMVAESPPASGKYFYDATGSPKEPLFAAIMLQLGISPATKEEGLQALREKGWVLVDATYQPVDKLAKDASQNRHEVIANDYPLLTEDLLALMPDRSVPVVLIKANVCRILEPLLIEDGYTVLNAGSPIYFPSNGRQPDFKKQFSTIVSGANRLRRCSG
jgi:hypothetical protein